MYGEVMFEKGNMFSLREGDFQVSCGKDLRLLLYQTCDFLKIKKRHCYQMIGLKVA